jgi:hypothetical protein
MKYFARQIINLAVRVIPRPLVRHFLKSIWYQPKLQDALRFHVQPYRFESVIPTHFDVDVTRLNQRRNLPGIQLNEKSALEFLAQLKPYAKEINSFPMEKKSDAEYWFRNFSYEDFDAVTHYCIIRHLKPKRIIEVGCGFSSRLTSLACRKNHEEGHSTECLFIEPYPSERLEGFKLHGELLVKKVEDVPLSTFERLEAGDVLFIDTTHIVKTQSDCCYELLEMIPVLRPGVWIHLHDIFTPYDYPEEWLLDQLRSFNEQYAFECLLSNSKDLEVVFPLYLLWKDHRAALNELMPNGSSRPGAFWVRKKNNIADGRA